MIEANELRALNDLSVARPRLGRLEEQNYFQFCLPILATITSDPHSDFYEGFDGLLRRQHPLIHGLQQIIILHSFGGKLSMAYHRKLAGYTGITQMHKTLQQT